MGKKDRTSRKPQGTNEGITTPMNKKADWLTFGGGNAVSKTGKGKLAALAIVIAIGGIGTAVALYFIAKSPTVTNNNTTYVTRNGNNLVNAQTNNNILRNINELSKGNLDRDYTNVNTLEDFLKKLQEGKDSTEKKSADNKNSIDSQTNTLKTQETNVAVNTNRIQENKNEITEVDKLLETNRKNISEVDQKAGESEKDIQKRKDALDALNEKTLMGTQNILASTMGIDAITKNQKTISDKVKTNSDEISVNKTMLQENEKEIERIQNDIETNLYKKSETPSIYTQKEVDVKLNEKASISDVYTKESFDKLLEDYYTKQSIDKRIADIANYKKISDAEKEFLKISGGTVDGAVTTGRTNFGTYEFITKNFVATEGKKYLSKAGGELTGALKTTRNSFENDHLISKEALDKLVNDLKSVKYIKKDGSTPFIKPIVGITPVDPKDLTTKGYVDSSFETTDLTPYLEIAGGMVTGNINLGLDRNGMQVIPTRDSDLINKGYVDGFFTSFSNSLNIDSNNLGKLNSEDSPLQKNVDYNYRHIFDDFSRKVIKFKIENRSINNPDGSFVGTGETNRDDTRLEYPDKTKEAVEIIDLGLDNYGDDTEKVIIHFSLEEYLEEAQKNDPNTAPPSQNTLEFRRKPDGTFYIFDISDPANTTKMVASNYKSSRKFFHSCPSPEHPDVPGYQYECPLPAGVNEPFDPTIGSTSSTSDGIPIINPIQSRGTYNGMWVERTEKYTSTFRIENNKLVVTKIIELYPDNSIFKDKVILPRGDEFNYSRENNWFVLTRVEILTKVSSTTRNLKFEESGNIQTTITNSDPNKKIELKDGIIQLPEGYLTKLYVNAEFETPTANNISLETQIIGIYEDENDNTKTLEEVVSSSAVTLGKIPGSKVKNTFSYEFIRPENRKVPDSKYKGFYLRFRTSGYKKGDKLDPPKIVNVNLDLVQRKIN